MHSIHDVLPGTMMGKYNRKILKNHLRRARTEMERPTVKV
jgi:hypothetical protein